MNDKRKEWVSNIKELVKEYDMEEMPTHKLISIAFRYSKTMEDSQVKALLYLLAGRTEWYEKKYKEEIARKEVI